MFSIYLVNYSQAKCAVVYKQGEGSELKPSTMLSQVTSGYTSISGAATLNTLFDVLYIPGRTGNWSI
jgi:hypothetical protein